MPLHMPTHMYVHIYETHMSAHMPTHMSHFRYLPKWCLLQQLRSICDRCNIDIGEASTCVMDLCIDMPTHM